MLLLLGLLISPLAVGAPPAAPPAPVVDEKLAQAEKKFLEALKSDGLDQKRPALDELVALGNSEASAVLVGEFGRVVEELRKEKQELQSSSYTLERRNVVLADLEKRAEKDASLKSVIEREHRRRDDLKSVLDKAQRRVDELTPWRDALSAGMVKLFETIGPSKRKKAELDIWKDCDEHPDSAVRIGSVDLLGRVGSPGTAVLLYDLIARSRTSAEKLGSRLSKSMADVREMEERLQKDSQQNGGRRNPALEDQYDSVKKEGAEVRHQLTLVQILCETTIEAGGRALERESDKDLEKSLHKLIEAARKPKDPSRLDAIALLTHAKSEPVLAQVRAMLDTESDPAALKAMIDGLAAIGDHAVEPQLIARFLVHENWLTRSHAATALATLRSHDGIPALIARLQTEPEGRVRTDVSHALASLTGKDFHGNLALWQRWWADNGATFVVAPEPQSAAPNPEEETTGVSFFGIETESKKVLFVLDLSGSMDFAMVPRNNPDDDPNRPPDKPEGDEQSRLQVAKRDLIKAISGLKDGGVFNLVMFASDVWTWADELVTMTPQARAEVVSYVEKDAKALGGTNLYGALERALDLAGAKGGTQFSKPAIDTIYFLTDGRASVGLTIDSEEILAFVRERNKTAGITIHTIGLSNAHDAVLLRRLAEENGGSYVGR
jgi:hypothetical protein